MRQITQMILRNSYADLCENRTICRPEILSPVTPCDPKQKVGKNDFEDFERMPISENASCCNRKVVFQPLRDNIALLGPDSMSFIS